MGDRAELVEAALDVYREGVILLDAAEKVVFWNRAAESITGYPGAQVVGKPVPDSLEPLTREEGQEGSAQEGQQSNGRGVLVHAQHLRGHDLPLAVRRTLLRSGLGESIGTACVFHPVEPAAALPHSRTAEDRAVAESEAEFEEKLEQEYASFLHGERFLQLLWISVDQGSELRKTHGVRACEAMLETVERRLANALRPTEAIGRWGDEDLIVVLREEATAFVLNRAHILAGLARTADFRWWGDRISLTVSVGAAVPEPAETLTEALGRARSAMEQSARGGGNGVGMALRRQA